MHSLKHERIRSLIAKEEEKLRAQYLVPEDADDDFWSRKMRAMVVLPSGECAQFRNHLGEDIVSGFNELSFRSLYFLKTNFQTASHVYDVTWTPIQIAAHTFCLSLRRKPKRKISDAFKAT
jgi:hypothetical protein